MHIFNHSVNIIAFIKNNQKLGMCLAWAMQVDDDKLLLLIGSQSYTGSKLENGDIIGISTLSQDQKDIALSFGISHSDEVDKFKDSDKFITVDNKAILVKDSYHQMITEVIDIYHLPESKEDHLVYVKIIKQNASLSNTIKPLHMNDLD